MDVPRLEILLCTSENRPARRSHRIVSIHQQEFARSTSRSGSVDTGVGYAMTNDGNGCEVIGASRTTTAVNLGLQRKCQIGKAGFHKNTFQDLGHRRHYQMVSGTTLPGGGLMMSSTTP